MYAVLVLEVVVLTEVMLLLLVVMCVLLLCAPTFWLLLQLVLYCLFRDVGGWYLRETVCISLDLST